MNDRRTWLVAVLLALAPLVQGSELPSSAMLLEGSIQHHDPDGLWKTFDHTLVFEESRPDGSTRASRVTIDLAGELFIHDVKTDTTHVVRRVESDKCSGTLDGSSDYTAEQAEQHRLTCEKIRFYRDYYTYLWGLPMKLRDPGTLVDPEVRRTKFVGRDVLAIRVTYDPEVGGDTWFFYFSPSSYALVGYRFYHDEAKNDGEYIVLEGEYQVGTMRIPKARTWYVNADDKLLGTDTLVDVE